MDSYWGWVAKLYYICFAICLFGDRLVVTMITGTPIVFAEYTPLLRAVAAGCLITLAIFIFWNIYGQFRRWRGIVVILAYSGIAMLGEIFNGQHTANFMSVVWATIFVSLVDNGRSDETSERINEIMIDAAQRFLMLGYFIAGIWKLGEISWAVYRGRLIEHFQLVVPVGVLSEYTHKKNPYLADVLDFLLSHPNLSSFLYIGATAIHVGALAGILNARYRKVWGAFAILFHIGTKYLLDFTFTYAISAIVVLFLIPKTVGQTNYRTKVEDSVAH